MTTSSGTVVSGSTARYKPFGGYRGTTPSQTITDRGFTGHLHNDSVGLIYMNARFYVPGVGRFASADTIVPDPANPQAFNRYSYVYNNPLKFIDPTGHCSFDPSTGEINRWDCSFEEFETMSISDRLRWIQQFSIDAGVGNWFNNIEGIIEGFVDFGLSNPGSWLSYVDAGILHGIQDGYARSDLGAFNGDTASHESTNWGTDEWTAFFNAYHAGTSTDTELISLWGTAEMQVTKYGEDRASQVGLAPVGAENFFLITGNIYRWTAANGGLGNFMAAGELIFDPTPLSVNQASDLGDWFNDPRSVDPLFGKSPVYWYSTSIWATSEWLTSP